MRTYPGEILGDAETYEPVIGSVSAQTTRAGFMHRHMHRRMRTPLKHQHPRGQVVPTPAATARQAILKVWQPTPKTTGRHLTYLTRPGTGEDGQRAVLFTAEGRTFDRRQFVQDASEDPGQYRLIIAPQEATLVDLPQLTRALMSHVEQDVLKAEVAWVAAVHHGVHPHVHLLMRGRDANGQEVHFTHDYRLRSMRYQVQHLLTRWLGATQVPSDPSVLDAWAAAHVQEAKAMQDQPITDADLPVPQDPPIRPRTLTPEEAQQRLEETRQRMQQVIARMQARGQGRAPSRQVEPESLQHQAGEPEHSQSPDQQATPSQSRGIEP
jgi:hypothetical protein